MTAEKRKGKAKGSKAVPVSAASEVQGESGDAGNFPIVGIGASAGGLAAIEAFFAAMPRDKAIGAAFVLVQHLSPDHKSILIDLVKRYTSMPVFLVEDGMKVRADCVYIIPPNRDMALLNGELQLLEPASPRGLRLPEGGGDLHRPLGHRHRRQPRSQGGQGRRRHGDGPGSRFGGVRRDAAQRHPHRGGGLCSAAGEHAGAADRLFGARVQEPAAGDRSSPARRDGLFAEDLPPASLADDP
jgi:hypothetical protein